MNHSNPSGTAGDLAAALGLPLTGDPDRVLTGAAVLADANIGHLAFVTGPGYFEAARNSSAGCLIVPPEYTPSDGQAVLRSPQPRDHFAQALLILYPSPAVQSGIHPSAVIGLDADIDPTAEIGPHVRIGAGARIGAATRLENGVTIGDFSVVGENCTLHANVTLYPRVTVGSNCILHAGAIVGADGFGFEMSGGRYRKVPQVGTVILGDNVEIGANTCIDRATLGATVIGDGAKLDNMVHIAHNCRIGKHVVIAAQTGLAGGVEIGDYAVVGGQVGVGDKARIESNAIVGSGAGILTSKIVRAGEPVWGTPARPLRQYLSQLATLSRLSKQRRGN